MKQLLTYVRQKKNLFACFAIVVWLAIAFWGVQSVRFETNDDTAMASIVYGIHGEEYDSHLVFINVLVGKLLCGLLELFPTVPWYTVAHCALILISFLVIIYLILKRFGLPNGIIPMCFFVCFFGWEFFCKLQFSKTAGIAVTAGLLLLFDTLERKKPASLFGYILSAFLITFGSMYRFSVFQMLLIPMFGIGFLKILEPLKNRAWKDIIKIILPFVVVFAVCFGVEAYDRSVYQNDQEWAEYKEFNSLRSRILDYGFPNYSENVALYESLGISEEDLNMYMAWDFADPEIFTTEALKKLVDAKEKTELSERDFLGFLFGLISRYRYSSALFLAVIMALHSEKKQSLSVLIYELLALLAVETYLYMSGRYNLNRIDVSIYSSVCVILLLYCWDIGNVKFKKISVLLLFFCVLIVPFTSMGEKYVPESQKINRLIAMDKQNVYFSTSASKKPAVVELFTVLPEGHLNNLFSMGGWKTQSPINISAMAKYGITNPFRDIVDNENAYLLCAPGQIDLRLGYIQRHYSPEAQAYLVKSVDSKYLIYRIVTDEPDLNTARSMSGADILQCGYYNVTDKNGSLTIDGYLVKEGINSYTANLYLGITDASGEEHLQYVTQHELPVDDIMGGQFGGFAAEAQYTSRADTVRLYLEDGAELYHYDLGTVADILQTGTTY